MKSKLILVIIALLVCKQTNAQTFKQQQLKYERVKNAYNQKEKVVKDLFTQKDVKLNDCEIFIRIFKTEKTVEVWAKNKTDKKFKLITTYDFCRSSGTVGPKTAQGDGQTPEGFYYVDRFNPVSNFYLSLGVDYPNKSDKIRNNKNKLGGDIFIHGSCVTIGCVPITDDKIMELYIMAVETRNAGQQKIQVHIFPFKMDDQNFNRQIKVINPNETLLTFWKNIKTGFDLFDNSNDLPMITVDKNGSYNFKK